METGEGVGGDGVIGEGKAGVGVKAGVCVGALEGVGNDV